MAPSSLKGYRVHRPVPVMRNAGIAYAERRYQLGAVLTTGARYIDLDGPNKREYFAKRKGEL